MEKKSQRKYSNEFLLDTSYLLPLVGIEVEEISSEDYNKILQQKLYYPLSMIAELIGVIAKEVKKAELDELPEDAIDSFNSIVFGRGINIVLPEGSDVEIACKLIKSGWNDIFDALLYATGKRMDMKILSLDKEFKKFLREHGYDYEIIVSHKEEFK